MPGAKMWAKMLIGGGAMCIGGPALIYWVSPSEEELFMRYNPELQRRSLENRQERQEDFDKFVTKLKEYSKSDQPIWTVWEREGEKARQAGIVEKIEEQRAAAAAAEARRLEIKSHST